MTERSGKPAADECEAKGKGKSGVRPVALKEGDEAGALTTGLASVPPRSGKKVRGNTLSSL